MKANVLIVVLLAALFQWGCGGDSGTSSDHGTESNRPPAAPSNPSPASGATDQNPSVTLSWQCSDPDGDDLTYDVYCGNQSSPPLAASDVNSTSYQPANLLYNSTYYWKVVATDDSNHSTSGPVWSFSTSQKASGLYLVGHSSTASAAERVFVSGQYAYVLDHLSIIDVSDPANPAFAGNPGTVGDEICVSGNYAYIARCLSPRGTFTVVNVANPASASVVGNLSAGVAGPSGVQVRGNYAYVPGTDTLYVINLQYATNPQISKAIYAAKLGGGACLGDIDIADNYAYVIKSGIAIFDVTNAADPTSIYDSTGGGGLGIAVSGNYAYVGGTGLKILDVADPHTVTQIGGAFTPSTVNAVAVIGTHVFCAAGSSGVLAYDVQNPASPNLVDTYQTAGDALDIFQASGYLYVAASGGGLYILEFVP